MLLPPFSIGPLSGEEALLASASRAAWNCPFQGKVLAGSSTRGPAVRACPKRRLQEKQLDGVAQRVLKIQHWTSCGPTSSTTEIIRLSNSGDRFFFLLPSTGRNRNGPDILSFVNIEAEAKIRILARFPIPPV